MNVSSSPAAAAPVSVSTEQALEFVGAALNKTHQKMQGETALKLLEPVQQTAPAPSANPRIGQNVNVTA